MSANADQKRCPWPGNDPLYIAYHDEEWGVPEFDDRALYEKLVLDGFQAGLSWITILRKREAFRRAFDGFNPEKIARYSKRKVETLMRDQGIVRNRAKIEGVILSAASRSSTATSPSSRFLRKPTSRAPWRRTSSRADSSSVGRPSSTPSCRRRAWSTTT